MVYQVLLIPGFCEAEPFMKGVKNIVHYAIVLWGLYMIVSLFTVRPAGRKSQPRRVFPEHNLSTPDHTIFPVISQAFFPMSAYIFAASASSFP
jgi:hypothetical protein